MAFELRQAQAGDAGRIAYLIMVWDQELPAFLRMVNGNAVAAQQAAEMMCGPKFVTWVVESNGEVVGLVAVNQSVSLFGFHYYGNVVGVFVLKQYRGPNFLGLKLLKKAMEAKERLGWRWLEVSPWADDINTGAVLERLGFSEATHSYVLR